MTMMRCRYCCCCAPAAAIFAPHADYFLAASYYIAQHFRCQRISPPCRRQRALARSSAMRAERVGARVSRAMAFDIILLAFGDGFIFTAHSRHAMPRSSFGVIDAAHLRMISPTYATTLSAIIYLHGGVIIKTARLAATTMP